VGISEVFLVKINIFEKHLKVGSFVRSFVRSFVSSFVRVFVCLFVCSFVLQLVKTRLPSSSSPSTHMFD
jgi:hypothetical protein